MSQGFAGLNILDNVIKGQGETGSYPDSSSVDSGSAEYVRTDAYNNLRTRGEVLTDELSYRDDFSGDSLNADWTQTLDGGTITVASSIFQLTSTATTLKENRVSYPIDYCPVTLRGRLKLDNRYDNQIFRFGFIYRDAGVITQGAWIEFNGTDNTLVDTVTCSSADASDEERASSELIPLGIVSSSYAYWKIDVSNNVVTFSISDDGSNFSFINQHKLYIPDPYQSLPLDRKSVV